LGEGNARADQLVATGIEPPLSPHCRARESHAVFHQNAKGLARSYNIAIEEARAIVKACAICSHHNAGTGLGCGVNPKGLRANEIWQMDVTHVPSLGRLKYLHVTIDTYSHMLWATPQ
ncbi:POK10 protein, partial [Himantopus himantopus]|nr:POK10 protein [Himantopus himantopus]